MPTDALDSPATFALRPGTVIIDRFRVLRPLSGASAYAITYLGDDLTRGEPIVIKEFFPRSLVSRAADGVTARPHTPEDGRDFLRAMRRFAVEGSVLSEIAHPHVVRTRGLVEANGTAYLVMDQHRSMPLSEYLQASGGRLTAPLAGRVIQHLLTALEPLHGESIVHRDLSPRSVHVQGDGSVLLLEFSARRHLPLHATDLATGFAAFEQYGMRDIGPWTDVYAASALLYYLLTGITPPSALDRAAGEALQSPSAVIPTLSPGLARLILRGMSLLPQQRPHLASELRRHLETALAESHQTNARAAQPPLTSEGRTGLTDSLDPDGATTLKLAAGGIVLPGEDAAGGLLRKLGSAASRFRRTPVVACVAPPDGEEPSREERPMEASRPAPATESAPAPVAPAPTQGLGVEEPRQAPESAPEKVPVVDAKRTTPVTVPMRAGEPAVSSRRDAFEPRADAASLALPISQTNQPTFGAAYRRRYRLMATGAIVVAVGSSMAFLARSSSASGDATRSRAEQTGSASEHAAVTAAPQLHSPAGEEVAEAAAVLGTVTHPDSSESALSAAKPRARARAEHRPAPAAAPAERHESALLSASLPNLKVTFAGPSTSLQIVSPEMLVDARTRLTNGQDAVDQGDYIVARRTFRVAMQQLDSLASHYPESEKIRTLRRELEQADARALQACGAENEVRKRRAEVGKPCQ